MAFVVKSSKRRELPVETRTIPLFGEAVFSLKKLLPLEKDKIAMKATDGKTGKRNPVKFMNDLLDATVVGWTGIRDEIESPDGEISQVEFKCERRNKVYLDRNYEEFRDLWMEYQIPDKSQTLLAEFSEAAEEDDSEELGNS